METIGIVLSMLAAVVLSGIIVRALPLAVPTPLVQIALGAVIAAFSTDRLEARLRVAGLRAEREAVFALARTHAISDQIARKIVRDVDLQGERIQTFEIVSVRTIGKGREDA